MLLFYILTSLLVEAKELPKFQGVETQTEDSSLEAEILESQVKSSQFTSQLSSQQDAFWLQAPRENLKIVRKFIQKQPKTNSKKR